VTALIDGLNNLAGASVTPIVTITETNSVRLTLSTSADQSAVIAAVDSQVCVGTATCTVTEASSGRRRALSSTVTLEVMRTIVYDPATASTTMIVVGDVVATAAQTVDATAALVDVTVSLDASVALQVDGSTAVSSVDELLTSEAVQTAVDTELALGLPCTTASIDAIITPPAPPPSSPSPPSPPSPPSSPAATGVLDPHFHTAHGDRFDFKGVNNTVYNLVSHTNVSVNALFRHADFIMGGGVGEHHKLVHGSFMRGMYASVKTNGSRTVHVEYSAYQSAFATVDYEAGSHRVMDSQVITVDDVMLSLQARTFTVRTPQWLITTTSKVMPGILHATTCANGRCVINVAVKPLFDADRAEVAPHGLIGQSYDGDGLAVMGSTDEYNRREITTSAMGEGAIEGVASDYKMADKFATTFAFTRFGKTAALPRNINSLTGFKSRHVQVAAPAAA